MKKQLVIASVVATLGLAGLAGGAAFATAQSRVGGDGIVNAIATKFNLKTADVQAVFDEHRTAMHAEREQQVKDKVAQLVKDGRLTQAQADKINAKRAELEKAREAERAADQNLTESQRQAKREQMRTQMDAKKAELDTWLKDNGIDAQYRYLLMSGHGHGHGGHDGERGRHGARGETGSSASTTSSSAN